MKIPKRITIVLNDDLQKAIGAACKQSGNTPSDEIRMRLARSLRVKKPVLTRGRPWPDKEK